MSKKSFWICLLCFAAVYLSLRLFWLGGDPGIPSAWEYGYNATDEGYYLGGGKEKFLWGCFVDLSRTEAFTYGFSAGTHWLSYLAHWLREGRGGGCLRRLSSRGSLSWSSRPYGS